MQSQKVNYCMPYMICLGWRKTTSDKSLRHKSSHHVEIRLSLFIRGLGGRLHELYWAYPPAAVKGETEERVILIIETSGEETIRKLDKETEGERYYEEEVMLTGPLDVDERIADALNSFDDFEVISRQALYRSQHATRL